MEKNKLGIVINATKVNSSTSGFRAIYRFNDDEWSSVVRDTGAELKKVKNNSALVPIHFIQFESNGCCYCIMQPILGRKDYQSAWIFIHKDIILPKGELSSIIQKVEQILSFDVEEKKAELDNLFEKPYQTQNNPSYSISSGSTYAVRYYGKGTDFVYGRDHVLDDEYRYQSEYCKYKSVFLVDKESGLQVSDAEDLSKSQLKRHLVIELPAECHGFRHNWKTNSLRVTEGSPVSVTWTRSGYKSVSKTGKCKEDLLVQTTDMKRSFRLAMFKTVDKVTRKSLNVSIKFDVWNDKDLDGNIFFNEEDLTKIPYTVELDTYVTARGNLNLNKPNTQREFVIELQPERHEYRFCIDTHIPDNSEIEFKITTQYKLDGTEFPGFKFVGKPSETGINRLIAFSQQQINKPPIGGDTEYEGDDSNDSGDRAYAHHGKGTSWWKKVLCIVAILLLVLAVGYAGYMCYQYFFSSDVPQNTEAVDNKDYNATNDWVEYLKQHHTTWVEKDMDNYPELKGVYAMIRDFRFKELKDFIDQHQNLKTIDEWCRLYQITEANNDKKGVWSRDGSINIEKYLNTDFRSKEDAKSKGTSSEGAIEDNHGLAGGKEKDKTSNSKGKDGSGDKTSSKSNESPKGINNQDNLN